MTQQDYVRSLEAVADIQSRYLVDGDRQAALGALLEALRRQTGSASGLLARVQAAGDGWRLEAPMAACGQTIAARNARGQAGSGGDWVGEALRRGAPLVLGPTQAATLNGLLPGLGSTPRALALALPRAAPGAMLLLAGRKGGYGRLKLEFLEPLLRCVEPLLAESDPPTDRPTANGAAGTHGVAPAQGLPPDGRLAADDLPHALLIVQEGRIAHANPAAATLLGHASPAGIVASDGAAAWVQAADRSRLSALLAAESGGEDGRGLHPLELDALHADGRTVQVRVTARRIRWGEAPAVLLALVDLNERQEARNASQRHQRLLQTVFDAFPQFLYVKDQDGRYVLANRSLARSFGCEPEALIGTRVEDVASMDPAEVAAMAESDRQVLAAGRTVVMNEFKMTPVHGEAAYYTVIKTPLLNEQGGIEGLVGLGIDITQQLRAQQHAEAQERLLRAIFDALPHSVVLKDRDGRYLMVNATFARTSGHAVEEITGRHISELATFAERVWQRLDAADEEAMRTGTSVVVPDLRRQLADGSEVSEYVVKTPLHGPDGGLIGVLSIALDLTERVRAEEELRSGRTLLRTVLDTIPHSVTVQDREGRLVLVNRKFQERCGMAEEQLLGRSLGAAGYVNETTAQTLAEADTRVLASGRAVEIPEEPFVRHGGVAAGYRRIFKTPILAASGQVTGIVTLSIDVTEQVESAQRLRESQRLLQAVFDTIPHLLAVKDREGRYVMVNPAYQELLGLPPAALLGRSADAVELFRGESGQQIAEKDRQLTEGRANTYHAEQVVRHADGHPVHLDVYKSVLRDDRGDIAGLVGIAIDVTERKAAEQREQLALSRLRGAIESHPAMFLLFDDRQRLVLWSSRAAESFRELKGGLAEGVSYEEIIRLTAPLYVDEDQLEAYLEQRRAEFRSGDAQGTRLRKDGRWIQFFDHRTEDGGTVSLRYDISELKSREQELQQAHKMEAVGQLTGGVAHDFNNLLTVILGNVELLKRYVPPVGKPIQLIERTIAAGERGAALTQRLLSFSRRQTLQPRPTDLNSLVHGMHDLLQRAVGESVRMEVRMHPELWPAHIDPGQLENALLNLVLNARDAMAAGGTMTIETDNALLDAAYARSHELRPGEYALIAVSDTGVGVPADVIERVFDPFFTTKEIGKGSGLGLSMVYGFAQQSSGHVRLSSEVGRGTTVRMYLPRTQVGVAGQHPPAATAGVTRGAGELVLIVEDDPHIAALAVEMLGGLGYATRAEHNAADAMARLEREPGVRVLFADVVLPGGKSGIELAHAARRLRPGLKVLFTTGYAEQEQPAGNLEGPDTLLLGKPYRRTELAERLHRVLHGGAPAQA